MTIYADLEIGLHRRDITNYIVDMRFIDPRSETDVRLVRADDLPLARFDLDELRLYVLDPATYGKRLTDMLFAHHAVKEAFDKARTAAQTLNMPLRVRLFIGPSAPDLHALRWEKMRMPGAPEHAIAMHEQVHFSRYLGSNDWQPIRLRPKSDLQALVIVANPTAISTYAPNGTSLDPVDVPGEIARAKASLEPTIATTLVDSGGQATLNTIMSHIRNSYDIVYLVAHGAMIKGEPYLWLETEAGTANVVKGDDLVKQLSALRQRPRLIVLASCQSAGPADSTHTAEHDVLAALGPRLCEIGIPAVLAMQGAISKDTVETFMPRFFEALCHDGQIDRAMAVARLAIHDRPDWWMPVLFMRLKSGRIWYSPGSGDPDNPEFEHWPALMQNIEGHQCTPILGTHMSELLGTQADIARRWAERYNFPLEPYRCEHLSQVAQYLSVMSQGAFPYDDLPKQLREELWLRYGEKLAEHEQAQVQTMDLAELFSHVGHIRRQHNEADPYRVLAEMDFPVYITTNFTPLLHDALIANNKDPQSAIFPWSKEIRDMTTVYNDEPDYSPSPQRPLVYHLFGHLDKPDSLVITEDDYFDYLIGFAMNNDLIPLTVIESLSAKSLLFLGFQPDDWDFRILFRSLPQLWQGTKRLSRRKKRINISAQIAPFEDRIQEPVRARRYLEEYLEEEADIEIYWGTVDDFAHELLQKWREARANTQPSHRRRRR